jgi:hypothetical protein
VWNKHANKGLRKLGFNKVSSVDSCVYYYGSTIFMLYVDDEIFVGPDKGEIVMLIKRLQEEFKVTDEGDLKERVPWCARGTTIGGHDFKLSQQQLIKQLLSDLWFNERTGRGLLP